MQTPGAWNGLKFSVLVSPPVGSHDSRSASSQPASSWQRCPHSPRKKNQKLLQCSEASKDAPRQLFSPGQWPGWLYNGSLLLTSFLSFHCSVCLDPQSKTILGCYNIPHLGQAWPCRRSWSSWSFGIAHFCGPLTQWLTAAETWQSNEVHLSF